MNEAFEEFKQAIDYEGFSCKDCKHCQLNLRIKNIYVDHVCYHESIQQPSYYGGRQGVVTPEGFVCNLLELAEEDYYE